MSEPGLHELLKRQMRKLLGASEDIPENLEPLLHSISEAYRQSDLDHELLERALEVTSEELLEANEKLRSDARELEEEVAARTAALEATNRDLDRQIKERTAAEKALREVEQRFRALAEHSPTGIFHSDADGRTLYVNESWSRITGLSREEALGDGWRNAIHPSDRSKKVHEWTNLVDRGAGLPGGQYRILRPDGEVVWVEGYASPLKDESGDVTGFVGSVHDITAFKLAEEIIRESEERYRTLFEQSLDCIYISSPDGRFVDINPAGIELFGFSTKQEALAADISDLYTDSEDREALLRDLAEKGSVANRELLLRRKTGPPVPVIASVTTVRDANGKVQTMRGVLRDVSETRLMEAQLRQSQKMEAVGRLAGGVAHDFNNLLTAIIGYADLLSADLEEDSAQGRNAAEIKSIARRGASLTRQLLAFSRRRIVAPDVLVLNDVVADSRTLLGRLLGDDIELQLDLDSGIGNILADPTQIEQIVVNLAINARDAMPSGGTVVIRTDTFDSRRGREARYAGLPDGRYCRLTVSDEGTGIDPLIQDRIFEPFFTTKADGKGTGLGLSTVYGAVKQGNGQIYLSSEIGAGTTFEVLLPEVREAPREEPTAEGVSTHAGGTETVLIAEDEPTVRQFLSSLLASQGYSVLTAENGEEALAVARDHDEPIDLLLSDVVMPRMSGIDLAREMRALASDTKILLVTGYSENQDALKDVCDAYLLKPFAPQALGRKLRQLLDDRRLAS